MPSRGCAKFLARWIGPFPITELIGKAAYPAELPTSLTIYPAFRVALLQLERGEPEEMEIATAWDPVTPDTADTDPVYEVEFILDKRNLQGN